MVTLREKQAIRLLGMYTAGRFDLARLRGRFHATDRADVLTALGGQKVIKSNATMKLLRRRMLQLAGDEALAGWAKLQN